MKWCKKCKIEYPEDIVACEICKGPLTEHSQNYNYEMVTCVEKEIGLRLVKLLQFSEIPEAIMVFDSLYDSYEIQVDRSHYRKAVDLVRIFKENEFDTNYNEDTEFESNSEYSEMVLPSTNIYVRSREKYKDNLSSSFTFLICGLAGIILILLENFHIIKLLNMSGMSRILFNVVLTGLFVGFICIGILSLRYSQKLKRTADEEDHFFHDSLDLLRKNLPLEFIEHKINENTQEEMKYFKRTDIIQKYLEEHYSFMGKEILIKISEEYYNELYQ